MSRVIARVFERGYIIIYVLTLLAAQYAAWQHLVCALSRDAQTCIPAGLDACLECVYTQRETMGRTQRCVYAYVVPRARESNV